MSKGSNVPGKTLRQAARSIGAATRKAARDLLSPDEQLIRLDARPGASLRERKRLIG